MELIIMWDYVKSLAEKLIASPVARDNSVTFEQYNNSFNQMLDLIETGVDVPDEILVDIQTVLKKLDETFSSDQMLIQKQLDEARKTVMVHNTYNQDLQKKLGFDKKQ